MRYKILLVLAATVLAVTGLRAAIPYAVYCDNDSALHFLMSDQQLKSGNTLPGTSLIISYVWDLSQLGQDEAPAWTYQTSFVRYNTLKKVVIEDSFKNYRPTSCYSWFDTMSAYDKLTEISGLSNLNTSQVKNMKQMFSNRKLLTSLDLSTFDTSNVTNMSGMFSGCEGLTSLDVSKFNTKNVTDMSNMFYRCISLTSLDVSKFNTEKVTDMHYMFVNCSSLTSLDVSNFNTSNVTNMGSMFSSCSSLTSLDVSKFNTEKVTDMGSLFSSCKGLTSLDLSNFNTSNATSIRSIFSNCKGLTSLDLSNFNTENVTAMYGVFDGCSGLTSLDVSNFNTEKVVNMGSMFNGCTGLTSLDLSNFNTDNVTNMSYMFSGCSGLTSLDLSIFDTSKVTTMKNMFNGCTGLTSLDLSNFNTEKLNEISSMFSGCSSLTSLNFRNLNMLNVNSLSSMETIFANTDALRLLDLSNNAVIYTQFLSQISEDALVYLPEGTKGTTGRKNTVVGDVCANFVINNGETDNNQLLLKVPHAFTATTATINRSFAEGQPHTLFVPFALNVADLGTFYTGGELNEDRSYVKFSKFEEETTAPNVAYMFLPAEGIADGITLENVSVSVTPEAAEEADGLNGVYEKKVFTADDEAQKLYYGWTGDEFRYAMEGASVDAGRAYFKLPASAAANAPARLKVKFGDDVSTGVTAIESDDNGADTPVYNTNGQRVGQDYRGIVVKNGRKVMNVTR